MDINYNLMVVKWSIFTLHFYLQLIYCASVSANVESLCTSNDDPLQMMERRIDSSLLLELRPNPVHGSCKRIFEAPDSHGFYVRLHRPYTNSKKAYSSSNTKHLSSGQKVRNTTSIGSCQLNIYQSRDKNLAPWRIDPCQLEANGHTDESVKFLEAPIRIVWNHGGNEPNFRLTVTTYGKGKACDLHGRHPCLKMGQEKHICISEDLICDGVQHCPRGNGFESDENVEMCTEMRRKKAEWPIQLIKEILRSSFHKSFQPRDGAVDSSEETQVQVGRLGTAKGSSFKKYNETIIVETVIDSSSPTMTKSFTRGLSRYGPWGYLMLGMLLCGGALLVCGLWECCCRKHKPTMTLDTTSVIDVNVISTSAFSNPEPISNRISVNYENDLPPSYSTLFPNQKVDVDSPSTSGAEAALSSESGGGDIEGGISRENV